MKRAALELDRVLVDPLPQPEVHRAGRREVPEARLVGALEHVHPLDGLGDEEVQVRVPNPVGMTRHVERDALEEDAEIVPMLRVEATQEDLVAFAAPRVLGDVELGHDRHQVARRLAGVEQEVPVSHRTLGGRRHGPACVNRDRLQLLRVLRLVLDVVGPGGRRRQEEEQREDRERGSESHGSLLSVCAVCVLLEFVLPNKSIHTLS